MRDAWGGKNPQDFRAGDVGGRGQGYKKSTAQATYMSVSGSRQEGGDFM